MRCEVTTQLHAVEVKNTAWWFRGRLCDACYRELERRRQRWMAHPQAEPGSLRAVRLAGGLSVREAGAADRDPADYRDCGRARRDQELGPLRGAAHRRDKRAVIAAA